MDTIENILMGQLNVALEPLRNMLVLENKEMHIVPDRLDPLAINIYLDVDKHAYLPSLFLGMTIKLFDISEYYKPQATGTSMIDSLNLDTYISTIVASLNTNSIRINGTNGTFIP